MNLDGLALFPLVTELNRQLAGGRIEKIFQIDKYTLWLWIRQAGQTYRLVIAANPSAPCLFISDTGFNTPETPPAFVMLLRKHLMDGRIAQITQEGLDRIVNIAVDVRGERGVIVTKYLHVELMGKHSNIILTANGTIIDAIRRISSNLSRYRQVLPNLPYISPPAQSRLNILTVPTDVFAAAVAKTPGSLTKALINTGQGIGPLSAKEIAWRAGLPAEMTTENLDAADIAALVDGVDSIVRPYKEEKWQPTVVATPEGQLRGIAAFELNCLQGEKHLSFASMSAAVEYAVHLQGNKPNYARQELLKIVTGELDKLERKAAALREELAEAEDAERWRIFADLLMANLHVIPPRASQIELPNYYAEDSNSVLCIPLDPEKSPVENAQSYYAKYNKLKRARQVLTEQLSLCHNELKYLESIACALELTASQADIAEIREELINEGYIQSGKKRRPTLSRPQLLTATAPDGFKIIIGKNNRQNDYVTFKKAQADDIWLHVKDSPGSHVILQTGGAEPSAAALLAAAQLAAYFSKARNSSNVPVDYTRRRYVKKPAGAKPGFVIYEKQHTIFVTPDPAIINRLLDNSGT